MAACDCLDLIVRQLFSPLPVCSDDGDTITGAICNGEVTYTNLAVNSGRATYQCDEGYRISDDNPRECQGDGRWSGTLPTCQQQDTGIHQINAWPLCSCNCVACHFQQSGIYILDMSKAIILPLHGVLLYCCIH